MEPKIRKFPQEVFVQQFLDEGTWFNCSETEQEALDQDCGTQEAGEIVAIYKLVKVVKITKNPPSYKTKPYKKDSYIPKEDLDE